jgi:hypothetical protein
MSNRPRTSSVFFVIPRILAGAALLAVYFMEIGPLNQDEEGAFLFKLW